jgi:plastocyanin
MSERYYQLGTHTNEQWNEIHNDLCSVTSGLENIPDRACTCTDDKVHSPTRGIFLLTDEEATALKNDARIKFLNVDFATYPETYKPPPEELTSTPAPDLLNRFGGTVKVYREFENSATLPGTPDSSDYNRTGYQLIRLTQKRDYWIANGDADNVVKTEEIKQFGDARDVDVIVCDDGAGWMGHPEFQNNCSGGSAPYGYVGGNVLPGNGTCDILDLILDGPYYLDPDYFDADAANRLTTRWDGTTVPVESFARDWWTNTANRSDTFNAAYPSAGVTGTITTSYTRANCNGTNTTVQSSSTTVGRHCTCCMALTYGRTQGWAYNANKWALNHYGTYGADIEQGFDAQKIFHNTKPVNSKYGTKDPTVSSNSWGYRASKGDNPGWYHFRAGSPVTYAGTGAEPAFISNMGVTGDLGRWKSEMKTNSYTTALDELCDSGVLFVCAAGNSNQKQVNWDHQDFDNFISANSTDKISDSSYTEFSIEVTGTTNRRGFPQQGGMTFGATSSFTIDAVNNGTSAYTLSNGTDRDGAVSGDNASIHIRVGDTISITNNATSSHPLYLKTVQGTGTGNQVTGATGQGASDGGTVSWTPTDSGTYYYQCSVHSAMNGTISVTARETIYKTINIGALDDEWKSGQEAKVEYSDRGNGIDFYAPADGTLAANSKYTPDGIYPDTYPGFTANTGSGAGVAEEYGFSGTSAACPVAAGFVGCLVGLNRNWTHQDVKDYVNSLDNQTSADFYTGTESTSATDTNWNDYQSLEGGDAKVVYQDLDKITQTTFPKRSATLNAGLTLKGLQVTIKQRFDRG